uniref:Uncharacterized protein n=1 Tax=Dromaius novaehollandiae TaxID=8790 RepID=A0A8C4KQC1_DRONO
MYWKKTGHWGCWGVLGGTGGEWEVLGGTRRHWEAALGCTGHWGAAVGTGRCWQAVGGKDTSVWSESANGSSQIDALSLESMSKEAYFSRVETFTISFLSMICEQKQCLLSD